MRATGKAAANIQCSKGLITNITSLEELSVALITRASRLRETILSSSSSDSFTLLNENLSRISESAFVKKQEADLLIVLSDELRQVKADLESANELLNLNKQVQLRTQRVRLAFGAHEKIVEDFARLLRWRRIEQVKLSFQILMRKLSVLVDLSEDFSCIGRTMRYFSSQFNVTSANQPQPELAKIT